MRSYHDKTLFIMVHVRHSFARLGRVGASVTLKLAGAGIAFAWQWLTLRILGTSLGGVVAIAQSQMRVIGTLSSAGRDRSLSLVLPQITESHLARRWISRSQWAIAITSLTLSITAAVVLMRHGTPMTPALYLPLIAVGTLTFALLVGAAGAARGLHHAIAGDMGFTILPLAIASITFLALGLLWQWSVFSALIALIMGQLVALLYLYFTTSRSLRKRPLTSSDHSDYQASAKTGIDQLAMAVATTFSSMYPDVLLITVGYLSSSMSAAAFGVAVRYIRLARFVPISFLHVREPSLARLWYTGDLERLRQEVHQIAVASLAVSLMVVLPLLAFPRFFLAVFGSTLQEYADVMYWVALAEVANSFFLMPSSVLLVARRARVLAMLNVIFYSAGLLASWIAVGAVGVIGAAIALLATNVVLGTATSIAAARTTGIRADAICAIGWRVHGGWRRETN